MSTNRADIVDQNFISSVREGRLPQPRLMMAAGASSLGPAAIVDVFETQVMSRHLDFAARLLKARGESFYTIGSAGHEGNAAVAKASRLTDMAFLHYRSGAFFIQRAKAKPGSTPIWDMLLSLCASSEDPIAQGRHKVFGSKDLYVPPQTSTIASHLPKAVGMAVSIRRAADMRQVGVVPEDSVVLVSFGDASVNHASSQTAFNAAAWASFQNVPVPLVFVCEDNGIGISVPTPGGWVLTSMSQRPGIRYISGDGRHLLDAHRAAEEAIDYARTTRRPAFLHLSTVRLMGHAGSDVEELYLSKAQIESAERDDPLLHSARIMIENGLLSAEEVLNLYECVRQRVSRAGELAITRPKLETPEAVMASVVPTVQKAAPEPLPSLEDRKKVFGFDWRYLEKPQHLAKLINWALVDLMLQYPRTVVFGEDVAQKGGVYHVTAGLHQKFGPRRIFNTLLDETTILGTAIGMAHNGLLPIPEIQFVAYVHNAEDQLRGEASTLSFFSQGQYTNGMVVRVAGLAYQKGFGGHFHNDNSLAVFRDLPGVIIACPSNGADAVMMMRSAVRAAHEMGRIVVFVEPIALYMTKDLFEPGDGLWSHLYPEPGQEIPVGQFSVHGKSDRLAIISYGNGVYLSRQAIKDLAERHGITAKLIDLRWLAPVDEKALADAVDGCEAVLIVDECRRTGSQSEALMAALAERLPEGEGGPRLARLTAQDCFIPLGKAATILLPSREQIVAAALDVALASKSKQPVAIRTSAEAGGGSRGSLRSKPTKRPPRG